MLLAILGGLGKTRLFWAAFCYDSVGVLDITTLAHKMATIGRTYSDSRVTEDPKLPAGLGYPCVRAKAHPTTKFMA